MSIGQKVASTNLIKSKIAVLVYHLKMKIYLEVLEKYNFNNCRLYR